MLGELENEARDYLGAKERELTTQGIDRVESQVVLGDTAAQIVDLARRYGESLVVMTCTGRSGLSRALLGSIADRVVRSCEAPVLLVHACGTL
ncbi:MAG: universal stress protein [Chloroflexi bacterium]|nr:universal stress protein [Chloroflexota bacterium]